MTVLGLPYKQLWCIDFEYIAEPGCVPDVVCIVGRELGSNRLIRCGRTSSSPIRRSTSTTTPVCGLHSVSGNGLLLAARLVYADQCP
jgi:hypothetical protein